MERLEDRLAPAVFTVTTEADNGDDADPTPGSLRAAILGVNASADATNAIDFNIPGPGVHTIAPTVPFPVIVNPVTVDGYSQPGASRNTLATGNDAKLLIELNGSAVEGAVAGLTLAGAGSTVRGLVINRFMWTDLAVRGTGSTVEGNFIGTDPTGMTAAALPYRPIYTMQLSGAFTLGGLSPGNRNVVTGGEKATALIRDADGARVLNNYIGVNAAGTGRLFGANAMLNVLNAHDIVIGGTDPNARNVIGGGDGQSILIIGGSNAVIQGNYVGVDATGMGGLGGGAGGIWLTGCPNSTIGGTSPEARNVVGLATYGVLVGGSPGTLVAGNYVGTNADGTGAMPNRVGVYVGGPDVTVGGTAAGARNVISGNQAQGVVVDSGSNTRVLGNYIGVTAAGNAPLPNGFYTVDAYGVQVLAGATGVVIGGTEPGARNVISGNLATGVITSSRGTVIQGNYIGVGADGTTPLGNWFNGVVVTDTDALVGGTTPAARNVISDNMRGVLVQPPPGGGDSRARVQGNYIGTDASGMSPRGNREAGVVVISSGNVVGGSTADARNVISANMTEGVYLVGANNLVGMNWIGVGADGVSPMGNNYGVVSAGPGNWIVSAVPGGGVIANSVYNGVTVRSGDAAGNPILGNLIYGNGGLGIDLGGDGVTPNRPSGSPGGPNRFQNYPVLTAASGATVRGRLDGAPNRAFRIDFYANPAPDPSRHGQGQVSLGTAVVTTDAAGHVDFTAALGSAIPAGWLVSATATDTATLDTSEFSALNAAPVANAPPVASPDTGRPYAFGPNAVSVSDEDGAAVKSVTLSVASGVLGLGSTAGLAVTGNNTANVTLVGTLFGLNAALGTLVYTPAPGFVGADTLTVTVNDRADPALGGPLTAAAGTALDVHAPAAPPADLVVSKSATPASVVTGQTVTYVVSVANNGPGAAQQVNLVDTLPGGFVLVSAVSNVGMVAMGDGTVSASLESLPAGGTLVLAVVARATAAGNFVGVAGASSATTDLDPSNNTAGASVAVVPPAPDVADLVMTMTVTPPPSGSSGQFKLAILIRNDGPGVASGVTFIEAIPENLRLVGVEKSQGVAGTWGSVIRGYLGDLAPGAAAALNVYVDGYRPGSYVNTASVWSNSVDPTPGNNSASGTVAVEVGVAPPLPSANLTVTMLATATTVTVGQPFIYAMTVRNDGPNDAHGVTLIDTWLSGVALTASPVPKVAFFNGYASYMHFDLGTIPAGASRVVLIVMVATEAGRNANDARLVSATSDPDRSGEAAFADVTVLPAPPRPPVVPTTVLALQRFGFHARPTTLTLTFSAAMDPTTVRDAGNYGLLRLGRDGRPLRRVPVAGVSYDPAAHAATLHVPRPLPLHGRYRLIVNASTPAGVTDASGHRLDGNGDGVPGGDFVRDFGREALAGQNPPAGPLGRTPARFRPHAASGHPAVRRLR